ncbi:MAG: GAF domain-containing protein [Actinobacteria bacterium]|uniref:Unannotated protein n=1 Tax=freshwater metagenome TaxID=449393 RepID=A0A6J7IPR9_9ZZZZ|nr:GAF domain-containing protein [Actinomycetota bacterium]
MPKKQTAGSLAGGLHAADVELLHESLRDAERRAALLTQLIEALNQSRDALTLLQRSVEAVVRAIDAGGAFVYLWDADAGRFVLRAATEGHQKAFVGLISLRPGEGLTGWSALMRRPVLLGDKLSEDPRVVTFPELQEDEFRSGMIVPILVPGGDTLGVFSIYSTEKDSFTEHDLALVDEVAKLLASGIDRANVVDQWERQSATLESLVAAADRAPEDAHECLLDLAHRCMALVPADVYIVESLDAEDGHPDAVALGLRRESDEEAGAVAVLSPTAAKGIASDRMPPLQAVTVALRRADRTLGVITAHRAAPFTVEDRALLSALAAYGAAALQALSNPGSQESVLSQLLNTSDESRVAAILESRGWRQGTPVVPVVLLCDPEMRLTSRRSLDSVTQTVESVFVGKRRRSLRAASGVVGALLFGRVLDQELALTAAELQHEVGVALTDKGQVAGVAVGLGRCVTDPQAIAVELRSAYDAAGWAALTGTGVRSWIASDNDLTHKLFAVSRELAPDVARYVARMRRIKDYDERHGTDLLQTLAVFVRERGAAQQASEQLFIHRNTLRQRLNKISSLLDEPIEQVEDWLPVSLAVKVLKT